jgi:hypothetical protein
MQAHKHVVTRELLMLRIRSAQTVERSGGQESGWRWLVPQRQILTKGLGCSADSPPNHAGWSTVRTRTNQVNTVSSKWKQCVTCGSWSGCWHTGCGERGACGTHPPTSTTLAAVTGTRSVVMECSGTQAQSLTENMCLDGDGDDGLLTESMARNGFGLEQPRTR